MPNDIDQLKHRVSLLGYLMRANWQARPIGPHHELLGLCPLHQEKHPSFYVNTRKNLFYCHGCGRGGDVIRLVQLYLNLSFPQALAHLKQEFGSPQPSPEGVLEEALAFYQSQLPSHGEALHYLYSRGLRDTEITRQMGIGYAPGGILRRHLTQLGYPSEILLQAGLINRQGHDTFFRRIILPCSDQTRLVNLYGRSLNGVPSHHFLPRPKGGLFAWNEVRSCPAVILVEGVFDLAVLWQVGFTNTTCSFGIHLSRLQLAQLCDSTDREIFIAFDSDPNGAGQGAAYFLAKRLSNAGLTARIVKLPLGQDPNSYFLAGAKAEDFKQCLQSSEVLH